MVRREFARWPTTTHFTAPAGVASVEATFHSAEYGHSTKPTPEAKFWLSDLTLRPLGVPHRTDDDLLVTLVMPLENDMPVPQFTSRRNGDRVEAEIVHPSGARDRLVVERGGAMEVTRSGAFEFAARVANENTEPKPTRYFLKGKLASNVAAAALKTNTSRNQELLRTGLKKLAEAAEADRDRYLRQGWKNIARDAEVTAAATRDERFDARNVIDNKTWELPLDGVVDYTLGNLETMPNGYGRGPTPYETDLSEWPLYFRPTYWLLPLRRPGDLTLRIKEPTRLKLVRLLNTTNAGLNDFATTDCRLELLGPTGDEPLWSKPITFFKPWDGAFRAAFARPTIVPPMATPSAACWTPACAYRSARVGSRFRSTASNR